MVLESGRVLVCSVYSAIIHFIYSDSIIYWRANVDKMGVDEMGINRFAYAWYYREHSLSVCPEIKNLNF